MAISKILDEMSKNQWYEAKEVADKLNYTKEEIKKIIDSMEKMNLVKTNGNSTLEIKLTEEGKEFKELPKKSRN